jgi:hypothetical protein
MTLLSDVTRVEIMLPRMNTERRTLRLFGGLVTEKYEDKWQIGRTASVHRSTVGTGLYYGCFDS